MQIPTQGDLIGILRRVAPHTGARASSYSASSPVVVRSRSYRRFSRAWDRFSGGARSFRRRIEVSAAPGKVPGARKLRQFWR
jgi:hypothetical protein